MSAMTRNLNRMKHQMTSMKNSAASTKLITKAAAQKQAAMMTFKQKQNIRTWSVSSF